MRCWHSAERSARSGTTSGRKGPSRTATSRGRPSLATAACTTSCTTRRCSSAWHMPGSGSRLGSRTTIGRDHTHPLDTLHRRGSPPDSISNDLLRYALRTPLRSPLLPPCPWAKQPHGSNPSWGNAGGHVTAGRSLVRVRRLFAFGVSETCQSATGPKATGEQNAALQQFICPRCDVKALGTAAATMTRGLP